DAAALGDGHLEADRRRVGRGGLLHAVWRGRLARAAHALPPDFEPGHTPTLASLVAVGNSVQDPTDGVHSHTWRSAGIDRLIALRVLRADVLGARPDQAVVRVLLEDVRRPPRHAA